MRRTGPHGHGGRLRVSAAGCRCTPCWLCLAASTEPRQPRRTLLAPSPPGSRLRPGLLEGLRKHARLPWGRRRRAKGGRGAKATAAGAEEASAAAAARRAGAEEARRRRGAGRHASRARHSAEEAARVRSAGGGAAQPAAAQASSAPPEALAVLRWSFQLWHWPPPASERCLGLSRAPPGPDFHDATLCVPTSKALPCTSLELYARTHLAPMLGKPRPHEENGSCVPSSWRLWPSQHLRCYAAPRS